MAFEHVPSAIVPNKEAVQVEVSPLLGLPPVVLLAIIIVTLHGIGGASLGDGLEEDGAPGDGDVVLSQEGSELQLYEVRLANPAGLDKMGMEISHPGCVLVGLEGQVQHLTGLIALLVHQLIADGQQAGEAGLDNVVEMTAVIAVIRLVAESAADGEQTLQTGENRAGGVCVEELEGEVHKPRPSGGEVILKNALEDGDELLADQALGGGEDGQEAVSDACLFVFGDEGGGVLGRVRVRVVPGAIDTVLYVDDG